MSEKHPGPFGVDGKLTVAEFIKLDCNYLRGTIA